MMSLLSLIPDESQPPRTGVNAKTSVVWCRHQCITQTNSIMVNNLRTCGMFWDDPAADMLTCERLPLSVYAVRKLDPRGRVTLVGLEVMFTMDANSRSVGINFFCGKTEKYYNYYRFTKSDFKHEFAYGLFATVTDQNTERCRVKMDIAQQRNKLDEGDHEIEQ